MRITHVRSARLAALLLALALVATAGCASTADRGPDCPSCPESAAEDPSGKIEPRYQPREPESNTYDDKYIFGMTRGVIDSTMHPAVQLPLMILTVPLDTALLPIAAVAGFAQ